MGIFGIFKKSDKDKLSPEKVFDTISSGIDKSILTRQEKAGVVIKTLNTQLEWFKLTANENTVKSKTRRYIAVMFVAVFLLLLVFSAAIYKFDKDWAAHVWELSKTIAPYVGAISIFYFGYYAVNQVIDTMKSRRDRKLEAKLKND